LWAPCIHCPRGVCLMRQFPIIRRIILISRRNIQFMVHPTVPTWRYPRRLRVALIDDPTAYNAQRRINHAAFGLIISVSCLILADEITFAPSMEQSPDCRTVPPGKDRQKNLFHGLKIQRRPQIWPDYGDRHRICPVFEGLHPEKDIPIAQRSSFAADPSNAKKTRFKKTAVSTDPSRAAR